MLSQMKEIHPNPEDQNIIIIFITNILWLG